MAILIILILIVLILVHYAPKRKRQRVAAVTAYNRQFAHIRPLILRRDGFQCRRCGARGVPLHVHHVQWRSRGGTNDPANLVVLCAKCHHLQHRHR
ncbi:MAG: HNH endonuclease [Thermomicrobia bacterium]|nr:HNH endonuclease [Thermomicrobia bacterium]MCA1723032.1 HNH endonuclease [Thermomicrobia bacterium]